jgi:hypothetical protein
MFSFDRGTSLMFSFDRGPTTYFLSKHNLLLLERMRRGILGCDANGAI